MAEPIKSIVIAGGGSAGWMAAAALTAALGPHADVALVESEDIGIVGVGEATVPPIRDFNAMIGLDEAEFIRETRATLKLGIEFVGWGADGSRYIHPFGFYGVGSQGVAEFHQAFLALQARGRAEPLNAYSLCVQACERGKAALPEPDPRSPLSALAAAYHFDAGLYARHLRRVCEARGVRRLEGEIVEVVKRPNDGFVDHLRLKDGRTVSADLFIDCTGFRALLIEGAMQAGFEDWRHWLPVNRALAAPCERVGPTTPYTRSTVREAGWQWRIPLQHRTGNGHVYCSAFTTDDDAREVLMSNLDGAPLAEPRSLRFTTGRRRSLWVGNVVALGLAAGFIEPLESTTIHTVQLGVTRLLQHFPDSDFSPVNIAAYNRRLRGEVELIRDFVILHYHATQRDEPFWREVAGAAPPDTLAERVELFRDRGLLHQTGADEFFQQTSWLAVLHGQNIRPRAHNPLHDLTHADKAEAGLRAIADRWRQVADALPAHDDFLRSRRMWAS